MPRERGSVSGRVVAGFEDVLTCFEDRVEQTGSGGAAYAVTVGGELVVDLWSTGRASTPWNAGTRGVLMSCTKGVAAAVIALLVDRGILNVETPVAEHWPEFARAGKSGVTLGHVLSHSAGLVTVPGYEEFLKPDGTGWDRTDEIALRLADATPEWVPGTGHAYHGLTYGWILAEIVRRVTGGSIGEILREDIAQPMGLELDLGTPKSKQALVAPVLEPPPTPHAVRDAIANWPRPELYSQMVLEVDGRSMPSEVAAFFARPENLQLEIPSSNATGTARAVAQLYGMLANGGEYGGSSIISHDTIEAFSRVRISGRDRMTGVHRRWGLGFMRPGARAPGVLAVWGPNDEAFGHDGLGGQMCFADPVAAIGVGFVRNHPAWSSELGQALVDATYRCLR